jgi:hypothetical protein
MNIPSLSFDDGAVEIMVIEKSVKMECRLCLKCEEYYQILLFDGLFFIDEIIHSIEGKILLRECGCVGHLDDGLMLVCRFIYMEDKIFERIIPIDVSDRIVKLVEDYML